MHAEGAAVDARCPAEGDRTYTKLRNLRKQILQALRLRGCQYKVHARGTQATFRAFREGELQSLWEFLLASQSIRYVMEFQTLGPRLSGLIVSPLANRSLRPNPTHLGSIVDASIEHTHPSDVSIPQLQHACDVCCSRVHQRQNCDMASGTAIHGRGWRWFQLVPLEQQPVQRGSIGQGMAIVSHMRHRQQDDQCQATPE
mmetsp:Transcript_53468/g.153424  ORF Transcript_53468/g.153424 Transcript_53468/m.153424 type:complete len:200 (-) Transcript_53468:114-713(-)